jgi:myosin heavy subunit
MNPSLAFFWNDQTLWNNNSSSFGKFIQISFTSEGSILGIFLSNYLDETTRIIKLTEREHKYHTFYQLFAGTALELATFQETCQCISNP